ncbi:MAG: hypothetical protein FWH48_04565 [Oscillospiraceae bacterium]|nr:hypothetical protein [Oscillospiraceae bacterium]
MNTKNIKTAILALLIIANAFFIYNILDLKTKSENIPAEMINDAAAILEERGMELNKAKIPSKKPSELIYEGVYEGVYSKDVFGKIVENFSGISELELEEAEDMLPAGTSYVAGGYRFIFTETNYFKLNIIELSYTDSIKDFSVADPETGKTELDEETELKIEQLSKKGTSGTKKADLESTEQSIKNFMKKYQNQDPRLGFEIAGYEKDGITGIERILINQTIDGIKIDFHAAYLEIQNGETMYFSGEWYFGEFVGKMSCALLDSVNILFKCMEIDGNIVRESGKLEEMGLEYTIIHHEAEKIYFTPSWRLVFENEKKLSYNMVTGGKN